MLFGFILFVITNLIIVLIISERKVSIQSVKFNCVEIDENNAFEISTFISSITTMMNKAKLHCSGYSIIK